MKQPNPVINTRSDVAELYTRLSSKPWHYHEIQRTQEVKGVGRRWPLFEEVQRYQGLGPANDLPALAVSRPVNGIAVLGTSGGVGATTVAAHLAAGLAHRNRRVVALDFSPGNALRLHFGMDWDDHTGLVHQVLSGQPWHEAAFRSAAGIDFVPFGRLEAGRSLSDFVARLAEEPAWLAARLQEIDLPADGCVICDCPWGQEALRSQVLSASQLAIIILAPDILSYTAAALAAKTALAEGVREVVFVLNGFDFTRVLDQDIALLMRTDFPDNLVPVVIHRDESLREALAHKQNVFQYAPASQACHDFTALAIWCVAHLGCIQEKSHE